MKVLFITRKWPPAVGGMELYSRALAAAMARCEGVSVDIEKLPGRADGRPPSAFSLGRFFVTSAWTLARRGRAYDVIHFGDFVLFPLAVWAAMIAPESRRLVAIHGLDVIYGRRRGVRPFVYSIYIRGARLMQGAVHRFIANSRATANAARQIGLREATPVCLGIDLPERMAENSPADTSGQSAPPYILFVGRVVARKGLGWFARSVLPHLCGEVTLKIVGGAWDHDELETALAAPNAVYLGPVRDNELAALRRDAAVTIMPNRRVDDGDIEGFGLAALEAAAYGSVLVAAPIEGLADAVIDGKTGFFADEGDARMWATKINAILNWPAGEREAFLAEARATLASRFSWDRTARETLALAAA